MVEGNLTIARLRAILAHMAKLIAVPALNQGKVALLGAVPSHVAIFSAVAASIASTALRAVPRKVARLTTVSELLGYLAIS